MLKKDLATLLGISGAMVTRLAKRGMPTDSLERAQRWRKRHLEPGRVKGVRFDGNYKSSEQAQPTRPGPAIDHLAAATGLLNVAAAALSAGACIDALIGALRAALAAVPEHERERLLLPVNVMDLLVADVAALLPASSNAPLADSEDTLPQSSNSAQLDEGNGDMTDQEADEMGRFWYRVAAGEIVPAASGDTQR